jgi:hypothetical protein
VCALLPCMALLPALPARLQVPLEASCMFRLLVLVVAMPVLLLLLLLLIVLTWLHACHSLARRGP